MFSKTKQMCDNLNNNLCKASDFSACMEDKKCKDATPYQILYDSQYKGCLKGTECAACCPYGSKDPSLPIEKACVDKQLRDCKWKKIDGKCTRKADGHFSNKKECEDMSGACFDGLMKKCGKFIGKCSYTDGSSSSPSSYEQLQECLFGSNYVNRYESFLKGNLSMQPEITIPECAHTTEVINHFIKRACGKERVGYCYCQNPGIITTPYNRGPRVHRNIPGWCYRIRIDGETETYNNFQEISCTNQKNSYFCNAAKYQGRTGFEKECKWSGPKNPFPALPLGYDCINMGQGMRCEEVNSTFFSPSHRPEFTATRNVGGMTFNDAPAAKKMCEQSCK